MKSPIDVLRQYRPHNGTLHDAFQSRCEVRQDDIFLVLAQESLTWREFGARYERFANALSARGIGHGDRVAVIGPNDLVHLLALFALARLGAIMVPVNPEHRVRELNYALGHADVKGVIVHTDLLGLVEEATQDFTRRPWTLCWGQSDAFSQDSVMQAIKDGPAAVIAETVTASDTGVIIYTSGTTGFPKGVMHSQENLLLAGEANVARLHMQAEDRVMIILPFFHVNALFYSLGGVLAAGASMIIEPRFSASRFWDVAASRQATIVNIIEAIGSILCARDRTEYRADHCLRIAYGVRKKAATIFRNEFGISRLFSGFGMTEVPGVTCNPYDGPDKAGSMGIIGIHPDPGRPWAQCRIVDDDGNDVEAGETGELWIKSPIVMQGYFRDPEQTEQAFEAGWFKTGDLVRRDADGFYFHISRKKDIIRRRGENIAAAEIEMVIAEHPSVFQVAALAVPSELGEDDIFVAVVARPASELTESDVAAWCKERLAAAKLPRYIALLESLPLTPTHKIAKAVLRNDEQLRSQAVDLQR